ncbi:MAG: PEGA domain-containing protein [Vicinamibacterales bacterium]
MTARLDPTGGYGPEAALSRAAPGDDPLAIFQLEPQTVGNGSGDGAALRVKAIPRQAPSVPFATPSVNDDKPRTAGVVNRIKRLFRAFDIARDFEKTVDLRLAALRGLDQEVQDRATRLERLNREISVGAAHADDILRAIGSFEQPLAELKRHQQDLRAIETTVAAFENRAQIVSTSLGRDVAAWEARKAAVVDAVEQVGRRAADTIDDLEGRVGDFEARAHIAEQTVTRLHDVSSRTLPVLQQRTNEAEEQNQSLERLITEAIRMAKSLTALEERLPAVAQCDQDLARIELTVPQIARQLEDLNAHAEQQHRALAVHQQQVRQTLDESQQTAAVVAALEGRMGDLSGGHQQLDRLEECVAQLEQRAATAVGQSTQAAQAMNDLEQKIALLQTQLQSMAETAQDDATKLLDLQGQAERYQQEHAERTTAIVSRLEARIASGHQLLHHVEEQMGELEQRTTSAATELKHVTDVRAALELEVVQLQNQLRPLTEAAFSEVKKLTTSADETTKRLSVVMKEAERYQRGETQRASAVLAGLETRMAAIGRTHRELDATENHVEQLEQRAAAAAGEVRHATRAKDELQREIANCQQQIERLTTAAQGEAEKLNGFRRQAEDHGGDRASSPSAHDLLNTLRFRMPNISRGFSPARLIFGGAALALSAAIVLLVGIAWRISPVENQRPEKPLPEPVLESRALTLAPRLAVAPPMPLTADSSHDRPEATRPTRAVPAPPVPLVVVSATPVATKGVPTAVVREQSVMKGAKTPQYVGTLLIESDPAGAAAFVNQESVGETPVRLKDLRAGSYVVRLEYEGYQRWSTAATVSSVRQERVKAKLERERGR